MTKNKFSFIGLVLVLSLTACGKGNTLKDSKGNVLGEVIKSGTDETRKSTITDAYGAYELSDDTLDLYSNYTYFYSSSLDRYITVNLKTGLYTTFGIVYSDPDCTGNRAAKPIDSTVDSKSVSKAIIYGHGKYFLANAEVTSFAYQSMSAINVPIEGTNITYSCSNTSGTLTIGVTLTETTQPKDFTGNIPLKVE